HGEGEEQVEGEQGGDAEACPACTASGSVTFAYLESLVSAGAGAGAGSSHTEDAQPSSCTHPFLRSRSRRRRREHEHAEAPQTKKEQKGRTSSSSPPAHTHSRSGTSRASGSRRFLRMKKGRRGGGLSWGIRVTTPTLPYLHLLLPLHRHLRPTRPSAKDKEEVE
ncbi:hypothetical protein B0H13DRAFT_2079843, partial [Mycena leptocephala]